MDNHLFPDLPHEAQKELTNLQNRLIEITPYSGLRSELREAAVLVPLYWFDNQWHLLFTRRSALLVEHQGQVSFPGGRREPGDASASDTALRESIEEIGLDPEEVKILGAMPPFRSVTHYQITPIVGVLRSIDCLAANQLEVDRIFMIPLTFLRCQDNYYFEERNFEDREPESVIFFEKYEDELLWGITGAITFQFLQLF